MLQIISGKFYKSDDRNREEAKGILYSNYYSYGTIKTNIASLEAVDLADISGYIVNYVNEIEIEKDKNRKASLIRTGDEEVIEQFKLLCSFSLEAFFHKDRTIASLACRDKANDSSDLHVPSRFVPSMLTTRKSRGPNDEEILSNFVQNAIDLEREDYKALISSLKSFYDAIQIIGNNIDLAYSLLVFSLESLAQRSDKYIPTWHDFPLSTNLDKVINKLPESISSNIKKILLKDQKLKANKRFLEFIQTYINDSFYYDEAPQSPFSLRESEVERALKNAYALRSRFAHELNPIKDQLRMPHFSEGDLIRFDKQPYLTISGLVRLAQHVINNFVLKREKKPVEDINWRAELPGGFVAELAPKYWIWKHENFNYKQATKKLSAFLSQFERCKSEPFTNIMILLSKYEKIIHNTPEPYKTQMFVTYYLFYLITGELEKSKSSLSFCENNFKLLDKCSVESMLTKLIIEEKWHWNTKECSSCWDEYQKKKYTKSSIEIPHLMTIAMIVQIASMYLDEQEFSFYEEWIQKAINESAGNKSLQDKLINAKANKKIIPIGEFFP